MKLQLVSGGKLLRTDWVYDEEKGEGSNVTTEIAEGQEISFLFDAVELASDLKLNDLFILLKQNPLLLAIYRRDWAKEFLEEYERISSTAKPYTGEYDPKEVEYLELYWQWDKNSSTGEIQGIHRLNFHGIGFELREDQMQDSYVTYRKGQRINWSISFSPLQELINLPLRLNPKVLICEDDSDSPNFMKTIDETTRIPNPMLGQVLEGILWELSFHGSPEDKLEAKAELDERITEVKKAIANTDELKEDQDD
jgi:hypothetical protein